MLGSFSLLQIYRLLKKKKKKERKISTLFENRTEAIEKLSLPCIGTAADEVKTLAADRIPVMEAMAESLASFSVWLRA